VSVNVPFIPAADIGLAKQAGNVFENGENFDVEFTLTFENTGNVALDNATIFDNVAGQFGSQFVGIVPGSPAIENFSGTGSAPIINAGFEGDTTQSVITSTGPVNVGDTFEVVFWVTIDPDATGGTGGVLENQATASGDAVDANGALILNADGSRLSAFDDSDNGVDPTGENAEGNASNTGQRQLPCDLRSSRCKHRYR